MRLAHARINLDELGIKEISPKKARTGAFLFEIPGVDGAKMADALASKMQKIFADRESVRITHFTKTAEIRVRDIEDSICADKVVVAVAASGAPGWCRSAAPPTAWAR